MTGPLAVLLWRGVRRGYAGGGATLVVVFFLLAATLFPFAIGPDAPLLARIGGGAIWAAALLAALLPVERLVGPDLADGVIDQLLVGGLSPAAIALPKTTTSSTIVIGMAIASARRMSRSMVWPTSLKTCAWPPTETSSPWNSPR